MGRRTGNPRGAPLGNHNRLKHGRYSRAAIARRQAVRERLASIRFAIAQALAWSACER